MTPEQRAERLERMREKRRGKPDFSGRKPTGANKQFPNRVLLFGSWGELGIGAAS